MPTTKDVIALFRKRLTRPAAVLFTSLLTAGLGLASASPAQAVANGEPVPNGKYRFAVKLTMTGIPTVDGGRRNSACSGALVAPSWVVTAGHCFRDANGVRVERPVADLTTATVGRTDLSGTSGVEAKVVAVRQSPSTDLALAQLASPVFGIKPIALNTTAPVPGDVVRLTGYGSTTGENPTPATRLYTGQFTVSTVVPSIVGVTGLAPAPDTSACAYDSGAPYFLEGKKGHPKLISVESDGPGCPHSGEETTARVDDIAPWISNIIH
ncbi:S1 family peptidase [Micromonospora chokoriensis]